MPFLFRWPLLFLLLLPMPMRAQLSGVVMDENGQGLPFATVYVQNTTHGVSTNSEGQFRLQLEPGTYNIVFKYVGYKQETLSVLVKQGGSHIKVQMAPNVMEIKEVVITDEDPAYRIMRAAIAKRDYYQKRIPDYSCDVYIKGFHKILDAPSKILGQDVGDMGGMLDSTRSGVLYLSESVSKLYVQANPARTKEVMVSSKVSGSENGFSINRAMLTEFNLYEPRVNIDRDLLSPLADNAFQYYRFELKGKMQDDNGLGIYKIAIIPKRFSDPCFGGFLYIVDDWFNLAGADVWVTGNTIKQPILDTLWITQTFVPVEKPDKWLLLSQNTHFRFGVLGFKIEGFFNSILSGYDINPQYTAASFDRENFKVENSAIERDSNYWASIRPIPLTQEEHLDYVRKDSLSKIWESKSYMDSLDHKSNRYKVLDAITGYTWRNSYTKTRITWPAVYNGLQYNTVQGLVVNIEPSYEKRLGKFGKRYTKINGVINYGLAEQKLRGGLEFEQKLEAVYNTKIKARAGVFTSQLSGEPSISPLVNVAFTLLGGENYMKLFEKRMVSGTFSRQINPGLNLDVGLELARRSALSNHSGYSFVAADQLHFTPNVPLQINGLTEPFFQSTTVAMLDLKAKWHFGAQYSTFPEYREYEYPNYPDLQVAWTTALPIDAQQDPSFTRFEINTGMKNWSWGLVGYSEWRVGAGAFLYKKRMQFIDAYHPLGNQTFLASNKNLEHFLLMPYYAYSTYEPWTSFHWRHHLQGYLLDKTPLLRRLNWKEVITVNGFASTRAALAENPSKDQHLYWEAAFGFENIGIKVFRPLSVHVAVSFDGKAYQHWGVVLGANL